MRFLPLILLILLTLKGLSACGSSETLREKTEVPEPAPFYQVNDSLEKDPELERFLSPYRSEMERRLNSSLAVAKAPVRLGQPESPLGNLTADILRYRATLEMERFVHVSLIDPALYGVELNEGVVTIGDVHDLFPSDEKLVVLELEGSVIRSLAHEIAEAGGVPVSGMRLVINDRRARSIVVDYGSLEDGQSYFVATGQSLLENDQFPSLKRYRERREHDLLLRDVMADYLRAMGVIEPVEDLRIRYR